MYFLPSADGRTSGGNNGRRKILSEEALGLAGQEAGMPGSVPGRERVQEHGHYDGAEQVHGQGLQAAVRPGR